MRLALYDKFKMNGIEYQVTSIELGNRLKRLRYYFKTTSWDEPVKHYEMSAKDFEGKVGFENKI